MKRRSFIAASLLSLVGIGAYSFFKGMRNSIEEELYEPRFLSRICDRRTLQTLGAAYLRLKPKEKGSHGLLNNLLVHRSQWVFPKKQDLPDLELEIEKQIKEDFDTDNIILVQGWVLSVTEARQCAYFSLLNN